MSSLTKKALSRIYADITSINEDDMRELGIFYQFDDTNISKGTLMIIGPHDSPYEGGFWFFSIEYPQNYPFDPPAMSTLTQDGYMRFGPNLYRCGKVCLSLLNTWHVGDKWSAVQTLKSISLSILSNVLVKGAWQNEPSVGMSTGPVAEVYDRMILHSSLKTIVNMIKSPPQFAKPFYEEMCSSFLANKQRLQDLAVSNIEYDNKTESMDFFRLSITYMFSTIGDKLLECSPINLIQDE